MVLLSKWANGIQYVKRHAKRYMKYILPLIIFNMRFMGIGNFTVVEKRLETPKGKLGKFFMNERAYLTVQVMNEQGRIFEEEVEIIPSAYDRYELGEQGNPNTPTYRFALFSFGNTENRFVTYGSNKTQAIKSLFWLFMGAVMRVGLIVGVLAILKLLITQIVS